MRAALHTVQFLKLVKLTKPSRDINALAQHASSKLNDTWGHQSPTSQFDQAAASVSDHGKRTNMGTTYFVVKAGVRLGEMYAIDVGGCSLTHLVPIVAVVQTHQRSDIALLPEGVHEVTI